MHLNFLIGILCWPVVLMGQSPLSPALTLFPVRSGSVVFYPHPPKKMDSTMVRGVCRDDESFPDAGKSLPLTLEQSLSRLMHVSPVLRGSDQLVGMARAEQERLRSFWYPILGASGAYVHLSQSIEVRQSMKPFAQSAKEWLHQLLPGASNGKTAAASPQFPALSFPSVSFPAKPLATGFSNGAGNPMACLPGLGAALESGLSSLLLPSITACLDHLGSQTLAFPILSSNLTGIQAQLLWPVFTGGKRIYATRIGSRLVESATVHRSETQAALQAQLVEAYLGLRLAQRVTKVRRMAWDDMDRHYRQAERMEQEGLMNKADRLFVQVACEEARREWESAVHQQDVAMRALQVMLDIDETVSVTPVSPLFLNHDLPPVSYFKEIAGATNYQVNQLSLQASMADYRMKMGQGEYLPTVALFGRQSLYTHHLPSHLMPRTLVGVGFAWNLFDGFRREGKVRRARCLRNALRDGRAAVLEGLAVGIDRLYALMQHAQDEVTALQSSVRLSRELLRIRRKSFGEGMATSSDVVDAETLLAKVQVAYLAAYYEFDVSLATLLSLCGIPETFWSYVRSGEKEDII